MPDVLLSVEELSIHAGQQVIVSPISFSLFPGEIVALTGPSGSGKTSIGQAILGLLPKTLQQQGIIRWSSGNQQLQYPADNIRWSTLRGSHIGYVQQDVYGAFDPIMRIGKQMVQIALERSKHAKSELEHSLKLSMEEVGLHDIDRLWNSYPHQLSGGQLQRCQLCIAIVLRPALIIADEPTSAIDKINQLELLDVLARLRTTYHMAILCITHESAVVHYLADRVIHIGPATDDKPIDTVAGNHDGAGMNTTLEVKGLRYKHRYGGMLHKAGAIVGPLDFKTYRGRCLGVIGESGSGKSTLAQLLVGLMTPDSGQIFLHGEEIDVTQASVIRELRWKVQLVMQDGRGSLHPNFTISRILNDVLLTRRQFGRPGTQSIEAVIHEVNLPIEVLDRKPGTLSGGECLRVSIARALLMDPEVLVLDEATSSLDESNTSSILQLLRRLIQVRGLTLLVISHDSQLLRQIADTILVLSDGHIVEQGTAEEILSYPTHPVTKKIFASHATMAGKKTP